MAPLKAADIPDRCPRYWTQRNAQIQDRNFDTGRGRGRPWPPLVIRRPVSSPRGLRDGDLRRPKGDNRLVWMRIQAGTSGDRRPGNGENYGTFGSRSFKSKAINNAMRGQIDACWHSAS